MPTVDPSRDGSLANERDFYRRLRALAQVLQSATHVAPLDVDVLITGPSGTGKSMLARALHLNSPRSSGPFVELNCEVIPEALIENELFGAQRGAHSTAMRKVTGKVAAAEGGTLFLDEVAELTAGAHTTIRADVRILSATNAKLPERVAARQFREDLFYRMHVVPLELPGLEERRDDIPELVEHFCVESCKRHRLPNLGCRVARSRRAAIRRGRGTRASWRTRSRQR